MADTMDLRSEGKGNSRKRQRDLALKAKGLCITCAQTAVKNRTMCYKCADIHNHKVVKSNTRRWLRDRGFDKQQLEKLEVELAASSSPVCRLFSDLLSELT